MTEEARTKELMKLLIYARYFLADNTAGGKAMRA